MLIDRHDFEYGVNYKGQDCKPSDVETLEKENAALRTLHGAMLKAVRCSDKKAQMWAMLEKYIIAAIDFQPEIFCEYNDVLNEMQSIKEEIENGYRTRTSKSY